MFEWIYEPNTYKLGHFAKYIDASLYPSSFVSLDLETTGLDWCKDKIIEIGATKWEDGEEIDVFQTYVNPKRPIPKDATEINGITKEHVKNAPLENEAVKKLITFVDDMPVIGHNINHFDMAFLNAIAARVPEITIDFETIDTLEMSRDLFGRKMSLEQLVDMMGLLSSVPHEAFEDARIAAFAYQAMLVIIGSESVNAKSFTPASTGTLVDEIICFTGNDPKFDRKLLMNKASSQGARIIGNVTKKVSLVIVCGDEFTGKYSKALEYQNKYGHPIILQVDEFVQQYLNDTLL